MSISLGNQGRGGFFRAKFRASSGKIIVHNYFLPSPADVRGEIIRQGGVVLSIDHHSHGAWWQREWYSLEHKVELLRAIAFYVETGKSAPEALKIVLESEDNLRKRADYEDALEILRHGGSFSTAIEALRMFDRVILMLLRAGESFGLNSVVDSAVTLMQAKAKVRSITRMFIGALSFELFTAVSTVWSIRAFAVPYLKENGLSSGDAATKAVFEAKLQAVVVTVDWIWYGTLLGLAALMAIILSYWFSSKGRDHIDNVMVRIPILRSAVLDGEMGETFGVVSRMLVAGVPFITAVRTLNNTRLQSLVRKYWLSVERRATSGMTLTAALNDTAILTMPEVVALRAHQDGSQLARLLDVMSSKRIASAQRGHLRAGQWGAYLTIGYIATIIGVAVWLLMVQDFGQSESMKYMMKG